LKGARRKAGAKEVASAKEGGLSSQSRVFAVPERDDDLS
jgi:hypothetical protein